MLNYFIFKLANEGAETIAQHLRFPILEKLDIFVGFDNYKQFCVRNAVKLKLNMPLSFV